MLAKIKRALASHQTPSHFYSKLVLSPSPTKPRDIRQVYRAKYDSKGSLKAHTPNLADQAQEVMSDMNTTGSIIQELLANKNSPPCLILYSDKALKQLNHATSATSRARSVIGVDRTFNLGACYVTAMVYTQANLVRKPSVSPKLGTHPIMLAAAFLHFKADFFTYQRFFSHMASVLTCPMTVSQTSGQQILFGSDEEAAILRALTSAFPNSSHILCKRHIKNNIRRHLRHKVGANDAEVAEMMLLVGGFILVVVVSTSVKMNKCSSKPGFPSLACCA